MIDRDAQSVMVEVLPLAAGFLPLPNIRLSKYISAEKNEIHPKLQPFPPGQIYNATKSLQIHVLATAANTTAPSGNEWGQAHKKKNKNMLRNILSKKWEIADEAFD